jgi:hypothetical protein
MTITTATSTGHFAISQTVSAVSPKPTALPTASTTGPVSRSERATNASRMIMTRVTAI